MSDRPAVQLHLLRHAHAGDAEKWTGPDEQRPLSDRGRHQAEQLGLFLAESQFEPDLILTSPALRALDTARLVATPLGLPVHVEQALYTSLDAASVDELLRGAGDPRRPLLVGHDPDFSELAAALLGLDELPLRKGAIIRIDANRPLEAGRGRLRWLLPPEVFGPE